MVDDDLPIIHSLYAHLVLAENTYKLLNGSK